MSRAVGGLAAMLTLLGGAAHARADALSLPILGVTVQAPDGWTAESGQGMRGTVDVLRSPDGDLFLLVEAFEAARSCPFWRPLMKEIFVDANLAKSEGDAVADGWFARSFHDATYAYVCAETRSAVLAVAMQFPSGYRALDADEVAMLQAIRTAVQAGDGAPDIPTDTVDVPGGATMRQDPALGWKEAGSVTVSTHADASPVAISVQSGQGASCSDLFDEYARALGTRASGAPSWVPDLWYQDVGVKEVGGLRFDYACLRTEGRLTIVKVESTGTVDGAAADALAALLEKLHKDTGDPSTFGPTYTGKPDSGGMMYAGFVAASFDDRLDGADFELGRGGVAALSVFAKFGKQGVGGAVVADAALGYGAGGFSFYDKVAFGASFGSGGIILAGLVGAGLDGIGLGADDPERLKVKFGAFVLAEGRVQIELGDRIVAAASAGVYPRTGPNETRYAAQLALGPLHVEARYLDFDETGQILQIGVGYSLRLRELR